MANPPPSSINGAMPRGISLSNSIHTEVSSSFSLPSLPVFCGALDQELRLFDDSRPSNRADVLTQASKIAELLRNTDVSFL